MSPPSGLPKMEYRFLGRSGLQVSAISLGGWLTYGGHVENGMLMNLYQEAKLKCQRENLRMHEGCL
jgi:aryl-alcohol dehydrogenase-like predicted oxidoreductase